MKIGLLLSSFYPFTGGRENVALEQAKELVKRGHEVHVFTTLYPNLKKEEIYKGIHIHRTKPWFKYKYYLEFNPGWVKNVLKHKLDILHVHSIGFFMADIAVLLKKLFSKTKIVNTPHGPFMALQSYPLHLKTFKKIFTCLEFPFNRLYDGVIQVNPEQWKWMIKTGVKKSKVHFIPNSIPKEIFKKVDVRPFVNKHKLKGKLVISYLGRIQKYKGLDQVIKCLPSLLKINPNIVFLAMGKDSGDKQRLLRLSEKLGVKDNVIITEVDDNEKLQGLDVSEIFVLPSEWEAFGIVLIEAMARGNVVVSTKTEGGRFLVKPGIGFLYDYKNIDQLKSILFKLIKNKNLRQKIQEHNKKLSLEYRTEKIVNKLEKFYSSI